MWCLTLSWSSKIWPFRKIWPFPSIFSRIASVSDLAMVVAMISSPLKQASKLGQLLLRTNCVILPCSSRQLPAHHMWLTIWGSCKAAPAVAVHPPPTQLATADKVQSPHLPVAPHSHLPNEVTTSSFLPLCPKRYFFILPGLLARPRSLALPLVLPLAFQIVSCFSSARAHEGLNQPRLVLPCGCAVSRAPAADSCLPAGTLRNPLFVSSFISVVVHQLDPPSQPPTTSLGVWCITSPRLSTGRELLYLSFLLAYDSFILLQNNSPPWCPFGRGR